MRILIVSQYFWPENFRINEIVIGLKASGHEVEVLTGKPNYPSGIFFSGYTGWGLRKEYWHDILIQRIPLFPRGGGGAVKLSLNYISFIVSGLLFFPVMTRKKNYDLIFVYGVSPIFQAIPAFFIGWFRKAPVVLWVQDLWPESVEATGYINSKFILNFLKRLVKFTYSNASLLLVQSKAFIKPVSELAKKTKILYYPNTVDKIFYNPQESDAPKIDSLESGFSVLFAGNVGEAQSMETIVRAAEILSAETEIKIVILGSGSKADWVAKEIVKRNLANIFLEGRYPVEFMPTLMRKASVLLVSLTDQPIFSLTIPNKIQAYLAVGRPIIASLNGEGAKLIEEAKAGLTAPAEDAVKLANAILDLYHMSDDARNRLGENGRDFFKKNFDEDTLIKNLVEYFEDVIKKVKN